MKSIHVRSHEANPIRPDSGGSRTHADRDDLLESALRGSPLAAAEIAAAYGALLRLEAEAVLGGALAHEAEDVVQDFFVSLLEADQDLMPARGRALSWMRGVVRAMARRRKSDRWRRVGAGPCARGE